MPLVPEFIPTLELKNDKLRIAGDVFRKMNITVPAAECACGDGGGFGRSIRKGEVEGLIRQENGTTCGMPVHDRFLTCAVPDSKNTHQFVLEGDRVVGGIGRDRIGKGFVTALSHQYRRADSYKKGNHH